MKWVTRARPKTDRIACPWLIRKFIDPDAEILYVPAGQVLDAAEREDAISFDAPGARYDHRDGKCTFEVLIEDHHLDADPALARLVEETCNEFGLRYKAHKSFVSGVVSHFRWLRRMGMPATA